MIISSPRNVNHAPTNVNHALLGVSLCPHSLSLCSNDVDVFVQINQLKKEKEKKGISSMFTYVPQSNVYQLCRNP